jgi:hypothetical protein
MEEEILNIEHHRKDLILKALNRKANREQAAVALGISLRTLQRDLVLYNIKKIGNEYRIVEPIKRNESQKLHLGNTSH